MLSASAVVKNRREVEAPASPSQAAGAAASRARRLARPSPRPAPVDRVPFGTRSRYSLPLPGQWLLKFTVGLSDQLLWRRGESRTLRALQIANQALQAQGMISQKWLKCSPFVVLLIRSVLLQMFDAHSAAIASPAHSEPGGRICTVRAEVAGPRPSPIEPRPCPASRLICALASHAHGAHASRLLVAGPGQLHSAHPSDLCLALVRWRLRAGFPLPHVPPCPMLPY